MNTTDTCTRQDDDNNGKRVSENWVRRSRLKVQRAGRVGAPSNLAHGNSGVPVHTKSHNNISSTHEYTRLANTTCTQQQAQTSCYMLTHVTYTTYTQSPFNTQTNTHKHVDTTRTQNNWMITNVWAVLCAREVPVTAHSEALCDQEPPSPPRPRPRPHDKLWEQRLRTKGPASPGCAKQVKFTVFAHVNCDPLKLLIDHRCLDLTDENACICCHNVSMVCPGANDMVCPAALATPMVLLTRVVAPKVCPQMKQPGRHVQAYALT